MTQVPQIKPKILQRYGRINEPVRVPLYDLLVDAPQSFLTSDTAAASGTLTVKSINSFAINQVLLIGTVGNDGSEIIKTHAATAPTGTTVTLASNTVFPHSAGTPVYVLAFDQVEFSQAATLGGVKSVLATSNLVADNVETKYNDTASTAGYYFARFKNSITSTFSVYSGGVPVLGYGILTARSIIDNALGMINKKTSDVLSDEFGFQQLNNCTMEVIRELKRWSFLQSFDTVLGELAQGQWKVAMPADLDDQNTNKSVYNIRFGTNTNLQWVDKEKWNELVSGVAYTTLAVAISVGDGTITLTDSSNFPDAGTVYISDNTYSYTANDRSTNILTLDAVTTTSETILADVFSGASFGLPQYWTTYGGNFYIYPVVGASYANRALIGDYYKTITPIQTDTDTIVFPDPTVAQYYLAWKFLLKLANGVDNAGTQAMFAQFANQLSTMKRKETMNRSFQLRPTLNQINMLDDSGDNRQIRGGNFPNTGF